MSTAAVSQGFWPTVADLVSLTKPRVTSLVIATVAVGIGLAPGAVPLGVALLTLLATVLLVGSANALNCVVEREADARMDRTRDRALPAGRLEPTLALAFGVALAAVSLPLLWLAANPLTAALGAVALISYVGVYTPMKAFGPSALLVGSVPGAMPPLMGWTSVTGSLDIGGLTLFAIVFAWQMPHVMGLSCYRREEYLKAGIKALPVVRRARAVQVQAALWALSLLPISLCLWWLGLAGGGYAVAATLLAGVYAGAAVTGWQRPLARWGRRLFLVSLFYLPLLFTALMLDAGA